MYRRRRSPRDRLAFGFDSFLDVVANVIGIIVRLILVAWVGAKSYEAGMEWKQVPLVVPSRPSPRLEEHPLYSELESLRNEVEQSRRRFEKLTRETQGLRSKLDANAKEFAQLAEKRNEVLISVKALDDTLSRPVDSKVSSSITLAELRERRKKLESTLDHLEKLPPLKKTLTYYAPVSRAVQGDEIFFEIREGRATFIDLSAFLIEAKQSLEEAGKSLKTQWEFSQVTSPVGAFRMRYTIERERALFDRPGTTPPPDRSFSYGLTTWELEPTSLRRGETLTECLQPKSEFRNVVDTLDPSFAVITFWVYPDGFETCRKLRDYLHERGHDVAVRPLPPFVPIAASRHGSASRSQ